MMPGNSQWRTLGVPHGKESYHTGQRIQLRFATRSITEKFHFAVCFVVRQIQCISVFFFIFKKKKRNSLQRRNRCRLPFFGRNLSLTPH